MTRYSHFRLLWAGILLAPLVLIPVAEAQEPRPPVHPVGGPPVRPTPTLTPQDQLNQAAQRGDWALVKTLIDANPKLLQSNPRESRYGGSYSILARAVGAGRVDIVTYLLGKGVDPNQESSGTSALNTAITQSEEKWKEMAEALVAKGADVNRVDSDGNTPLTRVLEYGSNRQKERVEWLLSKGADVTLRGRNEASPIELALNSGSNSVSDVVRLMLDKVDVKAANERGVTLLHTAVARGNLEATRLLLEKGADINAQDGTGNTPLHLVVDNLNPNGALMKVLLDGGANPNLKNNRGDVPLHVALRRADTTIVRSSRYGYYNEGRAGDNTAPRGAVLAPLTDKTDANIKDRFGMSSLLLALEIRDAETRDLLLEKAPKMDATTQLFEAAASGNTTTLETLLKQKPYLVYFRLPDGTTPLHLSALWGTLGAANLLVAKGASVNARDARGETPLHEALTRPTGLYLRRAKNMKEFLLSKGADVNALDSNDRSLLVRAVSTGELDLVKPLLDKGATPDVKDGQLVTPLMLATSRSDSMPLVQALLDKGANPNLRDQEGTTALTRAISQRRADMVKLLFAKGATLASASSTGSSSEARGPLGLLVSNYRNYGDYDESGANTGGVGEIFSLLLEKGADPNEKVGGDPLAVRLVSSGGSGGRELLKTLLATKKVPIGATPDRSALIVYAVSQGRRETIQSLLDAGADINEKDANGDSLLAIAKKRGDDSLVEFLKTKGAKE